jgi:predicted nicotinamide N-methyase
MSERAGKEIRAYGVRVLLARHPEVRRLKNQYTPTAHGNKFWSSSWLIMDYLKHQGLRQRARVMEVGCGWGLAGIYCAKKHRARVTGVDIDGDVFPFLHLHARINGVRIETLRRGLGGIMEKDLSEIDVVMGADICFWDTMVRSLKRLIGRARRAGVKLVLIADPGRSTFDELAEYAEKMHSAKLLDWKVRRPRPMEGQILQVGSL